MNHEIKHKQINIAIYTVRETDAILKKIRIVLKSIQFDSPHENP